MSSIIFYYMIVSRLFFLGFPRLVLTSLHVEVRILNIFSLYGFSMLTTSPRNNAIYLTYWCILIYKIDVVYFFNSNSYFEHNTTRLSIANLMLILNKPLSTIFFLEQKYYILSHFKACRVILSYYN